MYPETAMARPYTLKRRAETRAETRQRIVDAAVALHRKIGPAATSISRIAAEAGVQRNTLYAHFPDERSLLLACSGQTLEQDPLPVAAEWRDEPNRRRRLEAGLAATYAWYGRNADLVGAVLRDAEIHPPVREIVALRWAPAQAAALEVLGDGLTPVARAVLGLALGFGTWRTLVHDGGLAPEAAVKAMVDAIDAAG
jgi:AcrR family transcriptional regulator